MLINSVGSYTGLPPNSASQKAAALTAIAALSKRLGSAAVDRDRSPARYAGPHIATRVSPGHFSRLSSSLVCWLWSFTGCLMALSCPALAALTCTSLIAMWGLSPLVGGKLGLVIYRHVPG
jgi:hypothetical protein